MRRRGAPPKTNATMRKGEKAILLGMAAVILTLMVRNALHQENVKENDMEVPFYTTASNQLNRDAMAIYHHRTLLA